jgi:hypothetical protein
VKPNLLDQLNVSEYGLYRLQKPTQGTAPHHGSFNSLNSTHDVGWASFEDEESHGKRLIWKN